MEDRKIRRNLYRVLRKTGIEKRSINPNSTFKGDMQFDDTDWNIFANYLEGVFNISVKDEDLFKLKNVGDTILFLGRSA